MNSNLAKVVSIVYSAAIIAAGIWAIRLYATADTAPLCYILTGWAASRFFYRH